MTITVSNSQIGTWNACQQRWKYLYVENIVPVAKKDTYELGTMFHELTAIHDQLVMLGLPAGDPFTWEKVVSHAVEEFLQDPDENQIQLYGRALQAAKRYILEFCAREDRYAEIIGVEDEFNVPLVSHKGREFELNGYIDRLYRDTGRVYLLDRKTSATGRHFSDNELLIDVQLPMYAAAYREMGYKIDEVQIDSVSTYNYTNYQSQPLDKIIKRFHSYRTDRELDFVLDYVRSKVDMIVDTVESGNFLRSLSRDCARCPYMEVCLYDMKGIDTTLLVENSFMARPPKEERDSSRLQRNSQTESKINSG